MAIFEREGKAPLAQEQNHIELPAERGGQGARRSSRRLADGAKFAYHFCYHAEALAGTSDLDPAEFGVYFRLILLQYVKRGPLPDDDAWLARQNNCDLKTYRRLKRKLIAKGRLIADADAGIVYDERCVKELAAAGVLRQSLSDRGRAGAQKRWAKAAKTAPPQAESPKAKTGPISPPISPLISPPPHSPSQNQALDFVRSEPKSAMPFGMPFRTREDISSKYSSIPEAPAASGAPPATLTGGGAPGALRGAAACGTYDRAKPAKRRRPTPEALARRLAARAALAEFAAERAARAP